MRLRRIAIGLAAFVLVLGVLAVVLRWWVKRRMGPPPPAPIVVVLPEVPADNGYDVFLRAADLYVEGADPWVKEGTPVTDEQRKTLEDNAAALAELRRGLEKPCVIPPLASPATESYPATTQLRHLGELLLLESRVAREDGQPRQALASLQEALRYGSKLEVRADTGHRACARAIQSRALLELQRLLVSSKWADEELTGVLQFLAETHRGAPPIAQWIEVCHQMSLRGLEEWEADPALFAETLSDAGVNVQPTQLDGDRVRRMLTEHRNRALEAAQQPFAVVSDIDLEPRLPLVPSFEFAAFEILASIWDGFLHNHFIWRCRWQGTELLAAVELYGLRHGQPPRSLADLQSLEVPGIELPTTDPLTDKPFIYRPANGDYWLYSAGLDLDDDGGAEMNWQTREGDLVFHAPGDPVGERPQGDEQ